MNRWHTHTEHSMWPIIWDYMIHKTIHAIRGDFYLPSPLAAFQATLGIPGSSVPRGHTSDAPPRQSCQRVARQGMDSELASLVPSFSRTKSSLDGIHMASLIPLNTERAERWLIQDVRMLHRFEDRDDRGSTYHRLDVGMSRNRDRFSVVKMRWKRCTMYIEDIAASSNSGFTWSQFAGKDLNLGQVG